MEIKLDDLLMHYDGNIYQSVYDHYWVDYKVKDPFEFKIRNLKTHSYLKGISRPSRNTEYEVKGEHGRTYLVHSKIFDALKNYEKSRKKPSRKPAF